MRLQVYVSGGNDIILAYLAYLAYYVNIHFELNNLRI